MAGDNESFGGNAVLIGKEYTIELKNANNQEADYYCVLCNKTSSKRNVFAHWSSLDHRFKYLEKHFKSAASAISSFRQKPNSELTLSSILKSVAVEIEKKYGRMEHLTLTRDDFRRYRSKYLKDIDTMKHFSEEMGPDFVHIVEDAIANANLDGNKNIDNEGNKLLKDRGNNQAPVGNRTDIRDILGKSIDLDEISSDTDSDDLSKSDNQLPQKKKLKEQNSSASHLDGGNTKKDSKDDKKNSMHSLSLQASQIAQERYKLEKYYSIVDMEEKKMRMQKMKFSKNPESHPDYPTEWVTFWKRRSKELLLKNVDLDDYDFKPEWISYWRHRIIYLSKLELEKRKGEIRQQLGLSEKAVHKFENSSDKYKIENNGDKNRRNKRSASSHDSNDEISAKRSTLSHINNIEINMGDEDSDSNSRSQRQRQSKRSSSTTRASLRLSSPSPRRHLSRSPQRHSLRSSTRRSSRSPGQYSRRQSPRSSRTRKMRSRSPFVRRRSGSFSMSPLPSRHNDSSMAYRQRYQNLSGSGSPPAYGSSLRNSLGQHHEHIGHHVDDYHGGRQHRDDMPYDAHYYNRYARMYSSVECVNRIRFMDARNFPEYEAVDHPAKSAVEETIVEAPIDDGPLTLISVLRTLSALEQHLGSLGPKTLDLLSKALAIEKVKANESDKLLLIDDYCVFLETIKEKLKGLLITDLLSEPKEVRVIKQVIKNIAALIHQVDSNENTDNNQSKDGDNTIGQQTLVKTVEALLGGYPFNREVVASRLAAALVARGCDKITTGQMDKLIKFYVLFVKLNKKSEQIKGKKLEFHEVLKLLGVCKEPLMPNDKKVDGDNIVNEITEYNSNEVPLQQETNASLASSLLPSIQEITEIVREAENSKLASATVSGSGSERTNTLETSGSIKMTGTNTSAGGESRSGDRDGTGDGNDSPNQLFLLTDTELKVLIKNFEFLSNDEQDHLIAHLKKLENEEPKRAQSLRKYVDVDDLTDEVGPCSDALSKLTNSFENATTHTKQDKIRNNVDRNKDVSMTSSTITSANLTKAKKSDNNKSGVVNNNYRLEDDDDDEDDYNFDEAFLINNFRKSPSKSPILNSNIASSSSISSPATATNLPTGSSLNALTFKPPETPRVPLIKDTENLIANLMGSLQQNAASSSKPNPNSNNSNKNSFGSSNNSDKERFNIGGGIGSGGGGASIMSQRNNTLQSRQQQQSHSQLMQQQFGHGINREQQQQNQITSYQQSMSNMPSVSAVGTIDGSGGVNIHQHYQHNPQQQYMSGSGNNNNMSGYQHQQLQQQQLQQQQLQQQQQKQQEPVPKIHYNPLYGYQNSASAYTNYQHPHGGGGGLWQQPNNGPQQTPYYFPQEQMQKMPSFKNMYDGSGPGAGANKSKDSDNNVGQQTLDKTAEANAPSSLWPLASLHEITEIVPELASATESERTNTLETPGSITKTETITSAVGESGSGDRDGTGDGNDSPNQLFLLTDTELKVLIENFITLSNDEQDYLIVHLKKLEIEEPKRAQSLRKYVDVDDLTDEVSLCSDALSKLTNSFENATTHTKQDKIRNNVDRNKDVSMTITSANLTQAKKSDNNKSGVVNNNYRLEDDDDDEDDYNFDEAFLINNFRKSPSKSAILNSNIAFSSSISCPASATNLPTESSLNALTLKPPEIPPVPLIKDTESLNANLMGSLKQNAASSSKSNPNKNNNINNSNTNSFGSSNNSDKVCFNIGGGIGSGGGGPSIMAQRNNTLLSRQQQQSNSQLMQQQFGHGINREQQQQNQITSYQQSMYNMPIVSAIGTIDGSGGVNIHQHYQHNPQQQYMSGSGNNNNMSGYQHQQLQQQQELVPNIHYNPLFGYLNSASAADGGLWQRPNAYYFSQQIMKMPPCYKNMYNNSGPGAGGN